MNNHGISVIYSINCKLTKHLSFNLKEGPWKLVKSLHPLILWLLLVLVLLHNQQQFEHFLTTSLNIITVIRHGTWQCSKSLVLHWTSLLKVETCLAQPVEEIYNFALNYLGSHLWAFEGGPWDFLLQLSEGPWEILMSQVFNETLVKHRSILLCIWCHLPLLQLSSGFSSGRQCHFSCTLSGMLTHYGNDTNKFIQTQMPFL